MQENKQVNKNNTSIRWKGGTRRPHGLPGGLFGIRVSGCHYHTLEKLIHGIAIYKQVLLFSSNEVSVT